MTWKKSWSLKILNCNNQWKHLAKQSKLLRKWLSRIRTLKGTQSTTLTNKKPCKTSLNHFNTKSTVSKKSSTKMNWQVNISKSTKLKLKTKTKSWTISVESIFWQWIFKKISSTPFWQSIHQMRSNSLHFNYSSKGKSRNAWH